MELAPFLPHAWPDEIFDSVDSRTNFWQTVKLAINTSHLPASATPEADPQFAILASELAAVGYSVMPHFLLPADVLALRADSQQRHQAGEFRRSAVGLGSQKEIRSELRTDDVHWLEPLALLDSELPYWNRMQALRGELNRRLFLGLVDLEAHLACFSAGGFYKPHRDRHQQSNARILSSVLYLDESWNDADGGQLRLYTDPLTGSDVSKAEWIDIFPEAGKLVLFLSADFLHEVRKSLRQRNSLTAWFRGREIDATVP